LTCRTFHPIELGHGIEAFVHELRSDGADQEFMSWGLTVQTKNSAFVPIAMKAKSTKKDQYVVKRRDPPPEPTNWTTPLPNAVEDGPQYSGPTRHATLSWEHHRG
jgi:hypothetical protein